MSEVKKFRQSVGGYNRRDVIDYIEDLSAEHEKTRHTWDLRMERMRRSIIDTENRLSTVQSMADELAAELYAAETRAALAEKKAEELAAELYAAEHKAAEKTYDTAEDAAIAGLKNELSECRKLLEEKEEIESRLKHSIMCLSGRVEKSETPSRPVAVIHSRRGKK